MGRRQYLTVRKRRCNERQILKQRKKEKLIKKTSLVQRVYGIQGSIAPNSCFSKSSGVAMDMERKGKTKDTEYHGQFEYDEQLGVGNVESDGQCEMESSEYDRQVDMGDSEYGRHEMVLESNECDRQSEMSDPECNKVTKKSNDEWHEEEAPVAMCNVDESADATTSDNEQLDMFTYPDPLNWTFSKNVPDISGINFDTIGMDTEQDYLGSGPGSVHFEALQYLRLSLQSSELLSGWFVLPTKQHDIIQLCTMKTNRAGSPVISYTVEISVNCEWLLRMPQGILDWKEHPVLMQLPLHIKTIDDVKKVTGKIDCAKDCNGINDPKFDLLVTKHKGRFFDRSGKLAFN